MKQFFLVLASDHISDRKRVMVFDTKRDAVSHYRSVADDFLRFSDVAPEATIHVAPSYAEAVEYPDFVLSIGPRGGTQVEAA